MLRKRNAPGVVFLQPPNANKDCELPVQSDQIAPLLEGRPSCPSICPSLASSPSFGGASGFIPLKLFVSAKSPKKIAGGTGIIFKFNSDLLKQGVDLKFEFLNQ